MMTNNPFQPIQNNVFQPLYNLWCFMCLYALGFVYTFVELKRKLQWPGRVRLLDTQLDLAADLSGVVSITTGGTRGIGWEVCQTLLTKGAHVVIGTSQQGEGLEQLKKLLALKFGPTKGRFELWHLNLSSMDSVMNFVQQIRNSGLKPNLLINNAGIMFAPFSLTADGFESHLAINYLGHCLLTWHLLPLLSSTSLVLNGQKFNARIVNVTSSTHYIRQLRLNDLNSLRLYSPFHAYAQSKLAQIMFSYRLVRKEILENNFQVSIHCVHPGVVFTDLYQYVGWVNWFPSLAKYMFRNSKEGAETVLFAAVSDELENKSGKYLEDCRTYRSSGHSYKKSYQDQLFEQTMKLLKPWINQ